MRKAFEKLEQQEKVDPVDEPDYSAMTLAEAIALCDANEVMPWMKSQRAFELILQAAKSVPELQKQIDYMKSEAYLQEY